MSNTSYELIYFPASQGRAETIRLTLAFAGKTFTERGFERSEWPKLKLDMPLGQLPVLVVHDGKNETMIPQSQAILRHLGRSFGLYGKTEAEMTRVDVVCETVLDAGGGLGALVYGAGRGNAEMQTKYVNETWATFGGRLQKLLDEAPAKEGFFVGASPTIADLAAFQLLCSHVALFPHCLDAYAGLKAFHARMLGLPQLQAHLQARPQNEGVAARAA